MLSNLFRKYIKFIIVAAALGIVSMAALELLHWAIGYTSAVIHGLLSALIYLAGLVVNFQFQKRWVFATDHRASFVLYATWMLISAMIVGALAGFIFDLLNRYWPGLPFISALSLALALTLNSPVTFLGVSVIMRGYRSND